MGGFANNAPVVTDGLVFYVDAGNSNSYPGSGGTWTDLIKGASGSMSNMDNTNHSSSNGGIMTFDGSNEHVDIGNPIVFSSSFSCCLFFKTGNSSGNDVFLGKYDGATSFWAGTTDNDIVLWQTGGNNITTTTTVTDNAWRMLSLTYDNSSTSKKMYLNTTLEASATINLNGGNFGSGDITLGRFGQHVSNFWWGGSIGFLMMYDKALSLSEITQNYNALKNRFV